VAYAARFGAVIWQKILLRKCKPFITKSIGQFLSLSPHMRKALFIALRIHFF
jgi:hypothetical protein